MNDSAPLSFGQEALLLTDQLLPGLTAYLVVMVQQLDGDLDRDMLRTALTRVVRRHDVLCCAVERGPDGPRLVQQPDVEADLGFVDLATLSAAAAESAARSLALRWFTEDFDLAVAPLLRGELIAVSEDRHLLVLAAHHLVSDAVSQGILRRDLAETYSALVERRPARLPELPVRYADFAAWQREEVAPGLGDELDYWRHRLADAPPAALPTRAERPGTRRFRWAAHVEPLDTALADATRALAATLDTTPYIVLLAVFDVLVARWSGQRDIVVGTPVAGRDEPESADLVGYFVDLVALRARYEPDEPWNLLLARVRADTVADLRHAAPFHLVVEAVRPPRRLDRHPLIQVTFQLLGERVPLAMSGLTVTDRSDELMREAAVHSEFDLVVDARLGRADPQVEFRYATELYDAATMARVGGYFVALLRAVLADPSCPVGRLALGAPDPLPLAGDAVRALAAVDPRVADAVTAYVADPLGRPQAVDLAGRLCLVDAAGRHHETALAARHTGDGGIVLLAPTGEPVGAARTVAGGGTAAAPAADPAADPAIAADTAAAVRDIWCAELNLPDVDVDEDFFALGGGSFAAARVVARLRTELGLRLDLVDLFDAGTLHAVLDRLGLPAPRERPLTRRTDRPDRLPLSFGQQRMWYLNRLVGGSAAAYNIPLVLRLTGHLDAAALRLALHDLVIRHETLRTRFDEHDGQPYQVVLDPPAEPAPLPVTALERDDEARTLRTFAVEPFDLARETPLRARLYRIVQDEWILLLVLHHIAGDGWSMAPLLRDLSTAYNARRAGTAPAWRPLRVQYADYALWQRDVLGRDDAAGPMALQLDYWTRALDGIPVELPLPFDRPRPDWAGFAGRTVHFTVDPAVHRALARVAADRRATLFMVLQAALAALLTRFGAGTDIVFGTPVAGRSEPALDELVGFFVNTVLLRTDTSGDPRFADLVDRVRAADVGAYAHQETPFERLVEVLNPPRSVGRNPLFQVLLSFLGDGDDTGADDLRLDGLRTHRGSVGRGVSIVDLTVEFKERAGALTGSIDFSTALFDRHTVQRMVDTLLRLLAAVAADPATRVGGVDVLGDDDRHRLLVRYNDTDADVAREPLLHLWFDRQIADTPDAVAVEFGDTRVSYAELDRRARVVAAALRGRDIAPGTFVGVAMSRSVQLIATVLGVLKAGLAYAPVDVGHPAERIRLVLQDTGAPLVLVDHDTAALLPDTGLPLLDTGALADDPADPDLPSVRCHRESPAYVVYTSGSTGRPKGICMPHRAAVNLVGWQTVVHGPMRSGLRTLQFAALTFDVSLQEIFSTLVSGGTLVLLTERERRDLPGLLGVAADRRVNRIFLPAAALHQVAESHRPDDRVPDTLEIMVSSAEQLIADDAVRRLFTALPGCRFFNEYGPSETHVTTVYPLPGTPDGWPLWVPIGRPVANSRMYVLGDDGRPTPPGVPGELYIGGAGVANGYLHRPDLTAVRFVADPFTDRPGSRMYRTGDVVRYLPGGDLEFLGRADDQVKIRGFRIEPGEVEGALRRHPDVRRALVRAAEVAPGDRRLVAYLCFDGEVVPPAQMRRFLADSLPEYMVPAAFVTLPDLPLTSNGKVDVRQLPPPVFGTRDSDVPLVEARDDLEAGLVEDFRTVLGVARVGVQDDFFTLGGHSLLATRLLWRVHGRLGVDVSLAAFLRSPTVDGLAGCVRRGTAGPSVAPVRAYARARPARIGLAPAQRRLWLLHQAGGGRPTYNLPLAYRLSRVPDRAALAGALHDVMVRHESLRTVYRDGDSGLEQVVLPADAVKAPLEEVTTAPGDLDDAVTRAAQHTFDLAHEPPIAATLVVAGEAAALLIVVHHIAADGWSLGVLTRDLADAYLRRTAGQVAAVPDAGRLQYADYVFWQGEYLGDETDPDSRYTRQLAFWRRKLERLPDEIALPADRTRRRGPSHRGGLVPLRLDADTTRAAALLARDLRTSLFTVLHAAVVALLHRCGAGTDIPIGTPVAGRDALELGDVVGCFINTVVLRVDAGGDPTFRDLLSRVRDVDRAAFEHADLPFDVVVEKLSPARVAGRPPLFQVLLGMQYGDGDRTALGDVATVPMRVDLGGARADLAISLTARVGATGAVEGLSGSLEYSADLFNADTAHRLVRWFAELTRAAVTAADTPISRLRMLHAGEHDRVLALGQGAPRAAVPDTATVAARFAEQAHATPDAVAVRHGDTTMTYAELDRAADTLAHRLRRAGVTTESRVAVLHRRSPWVLVSSLAVLKAGGAYVPLHTDHPPSRMDALVTDAGAHVLLVDWASLPVPFATDLPVLVADDKPVPSAGADDDLPSSVRTDEPLVGAVADSAAYVMYTSGSTGAPKGITVTHRGVLDLVADRCWRSGPGTGMLLHSPYAFDISVHEMWVSLLTGARVVVAPQRPLDIDALARELAAPDVTCAHLTAGLFTLMSGERPHAFAGLTEVWTGGDVVAPQAVRALLHSCPGLVVRHLYGPTETTLGVTTYELSGDVETSASIPIGRPLDATRVYVLDGFLEPVPPGVPGEIYLAGAGMARGYVGRGDLTAERFVADPLSGDGARMYRTGDLGRWRADGQLEFRGRLDDQVKIRGFRVEPGEVESVLRGHPDVAQAVVVVAGPARQRRLLASVVPAADRCVDGAQLRRFLIERMPSYTVPDAVTVLERLPLTANGKLDRAALPEPAAAPAVGRKSASLRERILSDIVADVLGVAEVGVDQNFFDLGGHSMLAMRLVARIRAEFGPVVELGDVFEDATVASLARVTTGDGRVDDGFRSLLTLRRDGDLTPVVCVPPATGIGWAYSRMVRHLPAGHPVYALQAPELSGGPPADTLEELAERYLGLLAQVTDGTCHLVGYSFGAVVAHAMACRLAGHGGPRRLLAALDGYPGAPPSSLYRDLDDAAAVRALRRAVRGLEMFEDSRVATLARLVDHHHDLAASYRPDRYPGDVLVVRSTDTTRPAALWHDCSTGTVDVHDVAAVHDDLLGPEALAVTGPVLARMLRALEPTKEA